MSESETLLVDVNGARRELGPIGRDRVYQLVREGRIRAVRVGRKILIPRTELAAFIERELADDDGEGAA